MGMGDNIERGITGREALQNQNNALRTANGNLKKEIARLREENRRWLEWSESQGPGISAYREMGQRLEKAELERDEARALNEKHGKNLARIHRALGTHRGDTSIADDIERIVPAYDEALALLREMLARHDGTAGDHLLERIRAMLAGDRQADPTDDQ